MKKRDFTEILPFAIALLSTTIYFGMQHEIYEWYIRPAIAIGISVIGIVTGWYYVEKNGRNGVIFLGVSLCVLLLFIEIPITILGMAWN